MTPRDIFGLVIRTAGLLFFVWSLYYLAFGVAALFQMLNLPANYAGGYFSSGFLFLALGLYLLRGAPLLLRFSYPVVEPTWTDLAATDAKSADEGGPRA